MFKKAILAAALVAAPGLASAGTVVFTDSFEVPVNTNNWQVYQNFGDWASSAPGTTGIEIQQSGVVVNAHTGNQYVELDSDPSRGGIPGANTNSSMTRTLDLTAGLYELEWYYQPRTNTPNDNLLTVYLDGASDALMTNAIGSENGTGANGWQQVKYSFSVDGTDNLYALTFAAGGIENKLGGFVDSVTLTQVSQVPVPAAGFLLLGGLGGLVAMKRRKKAA